VVQLSVLEVTRTHGFVQALLQYLYAAARAEVKLGVGFRDTCETMSLNRAIVCSILIAVSVAAVSLPLSLGQLCCTPCNLNDDLYLPTPIHVGKEFSIVSALTVWCYGYLVRVRADLMDPTSYAILSTVSLALAYSPTGVYMVPVANHAVAPEAVGSWALLVQAYIIDGESGFSIGNWAQLFQVTVLP
jgi:hypothetical protein